MDDHEEFMPISFADVRRVLKKAKSKIIITTTALALLAGVYALRKPLTYTAKATFKEQGGGVPSGMADLKMLASTLGMGGDESAAIPVMLSQPVLKKVVLEQGLQGKVRNRLEGGRLRTFWKNLKIESSFLLKNKKERPSSFVVQDAVPDKLLFEDLKEPIFCKEIDYPLEVYKKLDISFISEEDYLFVDRATGRKGQGKLDHSIAEGWGFSFCLSKGDLAGTLTGNTYELSLVPLEAVTDALAKKIKIKKGKENKNILELSVTYGNRHLTSKILNSVMRHYKAFLKENMHKVARKQLDYLQARESAMLTKLDQLMKSYTSSLQEHVKNGGHFGSQEEMRYFAIYKSHLSERAMNCDLLTKILENSKDSDYLHLLRGEDHKAINAIQQEISQLLQRQDLLQESLRQEGARSNSKEAKTQIIERLQGEIGEIETLLVSLNEDEVSFEKCQRLCERGPFREWAARMPSCSTEEKSVERLKGETYLKRLALSDRRHLESLQCLPKEEESRDYEGLSLEVYDQLAILYHTRLEEVQSGIVQIAYIQSELEKQQFEMTGLSVSAVEDFVCHELIAEAARISRQLHDQVNRSVRDQERLREDLSLLKQFLTSHLSESQEVLRLRERVLKDKMISLKHASFNFVQEKLSLLRKRLREEIGRFQTSLAEEKRLVQGQQLQLASEMITVPERWRSEQEIQMQKEMSIKMIEELTKIVEAKNISANFERVNSMILNRAIPPVFPNSPHIILYLFLGAFLGFSISAFYLIAKAYIRGFEATEQNLAVLGYEVAGSLQHPIHNLTQCTLGTLRKLSSLLYAKKEEGKACAVFLHLGHSPDYTPQLATLFAKRGDRLLLINCSDGAGSPLQAYLEGQDVIPTPFKSSLFDTLQGPSVSGYLAELLASKRFSALIAQWKQHYDWIFIVTPFSVLGKEHLLLSTLKEVSVITLKGEAITQIQMAIEQPNALKPLFLLDPLT